MAPLIKLARASKPELEPEPVPTDSDSECSALRWMLDPKARSAASVKAPTTAADAEHESSTHASHRASADARAVKEGGKNEARGLMMVSAEPPAEIVVADGEKEDDASEARGGDSDDEVDRVLADASCPVPLPW